MSLDLPRIRAICFDVDGTLRDTDDQYVEFFQKLIAPLQSLLPGRDAARTARKLVMRLEGPGNLLYSLPDRLGFDRPLARIGERLKRGAHSSRPQAYKIIPGTAQLLDRLAGRYPLAIVTARNRSNTLNFLDHFELARYFRCIVVGQTTRRSKPHPDPIHWAAGQLGLPAQTCLMVGDTSVDIRAGKAAGAQTAGVLCGFGEEAELRRSGADLILNQTADLADVLLL